MSDFLARKLREYTSLDSPTDETLGDTAAQFAGGFVPVVGQAMALRDMERARRSDDYTGMALSALSLIPGGHLVKALRKGGDAAKNQLIAGKRALGAPIKQMDEAEKLAQGGSHVDDQWERTRAYVAPDGKPRWEINDANSKVLHDFKTGPMPETDIARNFHHPDAYTNYPELRNIKLSGRADVAPGMETGAQFVPNKHGKGQHGIEINASNPDEFHQFLLHELQHGVQRLEGHSGGHDPKRIHEALVDKMTDDRLARGLNISDAIPNDVMSKALKQKADELYMRNLGETEARAVENRFVNPKLKSIAPPSHFDRNPTSLWDELLGIPGVDRP